MAADSDDDGLDDLLDGDDDGNERKDQLDPIFRDILAETSVNDNSKRLSLDLDIQLKSSMMLNDDDLDDGIDDDDKEPNSQPENRNAKAAAKPLKLPHGLQAPPGLNIFTQKEGEHAFRYFSFNDLCIEKDFDYSRRPYLKGHGLTDHAIDDMLTDKLTFLRHLMPSAQSILICDKNDFKAVMDFLLYSISVCPEPRINDFLVKSFFDLAKNYDFYWKLNLKHIVTILSNYGIQDHAVEHCKIHLKQFRKNCKSYDLEARFVTDRRKRINKLQQPVIQDNKFTFCVSKIINVVSEIFMGLQYRMDFRDKNDYSELCALAFLLNIIATDKRFVEEHNVLDSVNNLYTFLFDHVTAEVWYSGTDAPVKQNDRFTFTENSFPKVFSKMVHDFPATKKMDLFCTWDKIIISTSFTSDVEHYKNIYHKIDLIPQNYRGNQVRKFLAYFYLHTLQLSSISENKLNFPNINDVVGVEPLMTTTCLKVLIKRNLFPVLLAIVRLWDIIVGNETEESFSSDKLENIKLVNSTILDLVDKKLPSPGSVPTDKLPDLLEVKSFLQVVKERWNNGCGPES